MLSPKSLNKPTKKYYLVVSRLVPYKRVDLIVQTFNQNALPLVIVGTGSEEVKLKRIAGANIKFVKNISDEKLSNYYSEAIALIHPQFEDFGLTVLEAISHGTPVIAYAKGGVLDMIEDGVNGILFGEQSLVGILTGLSRFHEKIFDDRMIRSSAKNFSYELFKQKILNSIQQ
jgi:glycosyltransferase involved in cell wall biosynthesis